MSEIFCISEGNKEKKCLLPDFGIMVLREMSDRFCCYFQTNDYSSSAWIWFFGNNSFV